MAVMQKDLLEGVRERIRRVVDSLRAGGGDVVEPPLERTKDFDWIGFRGRLRRARRTSSPPAAGRKVSIWWLLRRDPVELFRRVRLRIGRSLRRPKAQSDDSASNVEALIACLELLGRGVRDLDARVRRLERAADESDAPATGRAA
jgi:hypothetical protein